MKRILKIEEFAMFIGPTILFLHIKQNLILFLLIIMLPDLSMIGYLVNPKIGAITYNLVHHKATAIAVGIFGLILHREVLIFSGLILFAHSSLDRVLGYGLKYDDSFEHTHLGKIGK